MTIETVISIVLLALLFEFVTVALRLVSHLRSARIQHSLKMPRIHHAYPGGVLVLLYLVVKEPLLLIVGGALVFSDIMHHLLIIPLLRVLHIDVHMRHHTVAHYALQLVAEVLLVALGGVVLYGGVFSGV